jgi:hypothetical protein
MPSLRNLHKLLDSEIRAKNVRAIKLAVRGLYWDLVRSQAPDPVFVVGCSRGRSVVAVDVPAGAPLVLFPHDPAAAAECLWL